MTDKEWDDIDGGWEDVELDADGKKKRTRARGSRGKRRATAQQRPVDEPQKPPRKKQPKPKAAGEASTKQSNKASRPWLIPLLAAVGAIVVFVLFLLASKH